MATGTTNVGFEEKLWLAADKLRSNMDAAEYKHVVLGLIFLKYVSGIISPLLSECANGYISSNLSNNMTSFFIPIN